MAYTSSYLCQITGLTRQRLAHLRKLGRLVKGVHWDWNDGQIEYTQLAIELLSQDRRAGRPRKL